MTRSFSSCCYWLDGTTSVCDSDGEDEGAGLVHVGEQERASLMHHNSSSLKRHEPAEMCVLQAPLQSLTCNLPEFSLQNSPASSEKAYDIPGMLGVPCGNFTFFIY